MLDLQPTVPHQIHQAMEVHSTGAAQLTQSCKSNRCRGQLDKQKAIGSASLPVTGVAVAIFSQSCWCRDPPRMQLSLCLSSQASDVGSHCRCKYSEAVYDQ